MRWHRAPLLLALLVPCAPQVTRAEEQVAKSSNSISAEKIREHISFLASDELEGRDSGEPGLEVAAEYIANRFGGGDYRAKILGDWDPERRCEEYFERVSFAIDGCFRVTDETLARTRSQQQK